MFDCRAQEIFHIPNDASIGRNIPFAYPFCHYAKEQHRFISQASQLAALKVDMQNQCTVHMEIAYEATMCERGAVYLTMERHLTIIKQQPLSSLLQFTTSRYYQWPIPFRSHTRLTSFYKKNCQLADMLRKDNKTQAFNVFFSSLTLRSLAMQRVSARLTSSATGIKYHL